MMVPIKTETAVLSPTELDVIADVDCFDWVFFTSQNGVDPFFDALFTRKMDARSLATTKVAAIGQATANALKHRGIFPDLVPTTFTTGGLLASFTNLSPAERGERALLPRADIATKELPAGLRALGLEVTEIATYHTVQANPHPAELLRLREGEVDYVTFTSSSTARNLAKLLGSNDFIIASERSRFVSIGPITSAAIRELGATVAVEAERSDIPGLTAG